MNDDQLQFDRTCHVIYSRPCKAEIREKIAHHCIFRKNCASVPEERSAIPLQTEQSSAG